MSNHKILATHISTDGYNIILEKISKSIKLKKTFLCSPLASQTLVLGYLSPSLQKILNDFDSLYPDSQYVRLALWLLHDIWLPDRVYGPELMLQVCKYSQIHKYSIFLYGTTNQTLIKLCSSLREKFHDLKIAGSCASRFDRLSKAQKKDLISKIDKSGAEILMIGMGSPLEQVFCHELIFDSPKLRKSIVIIPFGAAFDFIAGVKSQAPKWIGNNGLEWLYRLMHEPSRLWYRYLFLGPVFLILVFFQKIRSLFDTGN